MKPKINIKAVLAKFKSDKIIEQSKPKDVAAARKKALALAFAE